MTFEQLVADTLETVSQNASSPTQLVLALGLALKQAEEYEDKWMNELYEQQDIEFYCH